MVKLKNKTLALVIFLITLIILTIAFLKTSEKRLNKEVIEKESEVTKVISYPSYTEESFSSSRDESRKLFKSGLDINVKRINLDEYEEEYDVFFLDVSGEVVRLNKGVAKNVTETNGSVGNFIIDKDAKYLVYTTNTDYKNIFDVTNIPEEHLRTREVKVTDTVYSKNLITSEVEKIIEVPSQSINYSDYEMGPPGLGQTIVFLKELWLIDMIPNTDKFMYLVDGFYYSYDLKTHETKKLNQEEYDQYTFCSFTVRGVVSESGILIIRGCYEGGRGELYKYNPVEDNVQDRIELDVELFYYVTGHYPILIDDENIFVVDSNPGVNGPGNSVKRYSFETLELQDTIDIFVNDISLYCWPQIYKDLESGEYKLSCYDYELETLFIFTYYDGQMKLDERYVIDDNQEENTYRLLGSAFDKGQHIFSESDRDNLFLLDTESNVFIEIHRSGDYYSKIKIL